jgi:hypothetical protein
MTITVLKRHDGGLGSQQRYSGIGLFWPKEFFVAADLL